ncbi:hypothetical protein ACEPPN_006142 [Leptodophora sp. 'Broadleaf-Isolate-01']
MISKKMEAQAKKPPPKPDTPAQAMEEERQNRAAEETNEFELDPWNASVVAEPDGEDEDGDVVVGAMNVQETPVVDDGKIDEQKSEMEWLPEGKSLQTKNFFSGRRW